MPALVLSLTCTIRASQEDSTEPQERQAKKLFSFVAWFRSGLLLAVMFSGFITSILGIALLGYILLSRSYAPPTAHLAKDMYFDYTQEAAIATASFVDAAQYKVSSGDNGSAFTKYMLAPVTCEAGSRVLRDLQHQPCMYLP